MIHPPLFWTFFPSSESNSQPQLSTRIKRATHYGCPCLHEGNFSLRTRLLCTILLVKGFNLKLVLFHQSLQDLIASEGQLVVLECRVKGVPSPRVDWYREGKIMEDSPDFRILQKSKFFAKISSFSIFL